MSLYQEKLAEFYQKLGVAKKFVLATSKEDRVTARTMSCICFDQAVYFQTDSNFLKYEQLISNPQVALCSDNIQIEGIATDLGHPMDVDNLFFAKVFEQRYKSSFDSYTGLETEVLVKIVPKKITLWEYQNGSAVRLIFDIEKEEYREEPYL